MKITLLNIVFGSVIWVCPLDAVHACPEGVPTRPTPKAAKKRFVEGDPSLSRGRSPRLEGAVRIFGRRACVRRAGVLLARHAERRQKTATCRVEQRCRWRGGCCTAMGDGRGNTHAWPRRAGPLCFWAGYARDGVR